MPLNAARPLRYMDEFYTVTQGEVYYATELLNQLEGLQRGPAGNTGLAAAISLARTMDEDQIIVVEESEYTGAGKAHTAQLTFAEDHGVDVRIGQHEEEIPGTNIIIPATPQDIRTIPVDMDEMRRKYIKMNVKDKGFDNLTAEEVEFLAAETNLDIAGIRSCWMTWTSPSPKKEIHERSPGNIKSPRLLIVEAPTRIELVIEVLQTFALPLGYGALSSICIITNARDLVNILKA